MGIIRSVFKLGELEHRSTLRLSPDVISNGSPAQSTSGSPTLEHDLIVRGGIEGGGCGSGSHGSKSQSLVALFPRGPITPCLFTGWKILCVCL